MQAAREAARRIQCANNLKQQGLALQNYHGAMRSFPAGIVTPNHTFWSGALLPFLEQDNLFNTLDFSEDWSTNSHPNGQACATLLNVFRCPSANAPRAVSVQGVAGRVPSTYLAVGSGTDTRESGGVPEHIGRARRDGLMYLNSFHRMRDVIDGTSNTLAIGEALFRIDVRGPDLDGQSLQIVDHWYIGSDGVLQTANGMLEMSEAVGSTGVPLNGVFDDIWIDAKELGYSSHHTGGVLFVFADGHVQFLSESIDMGVFSSGGTIAGFEVSLFD